MRFALGIEYDGSAYSGWQRLAPAGSPERAPTLQGTLEAALSSVADTAIATVCAGRTDAGVHARCQVVHFETDAIREPRGWMLGTTARLPRDMSVRWCVPVAGDFSARHGAVARRYRYSILNRAARPAIERHAVAWVRTPLDADAMHAAAQSLRGERDFSAFRTVQCQARHPHRDLQSIRVWREGERVTVDVRANAFLHHMVRNIVGSLLLVGTGERAPGWIAELLAGRDRTRAGPTAAAAGLCFVGPLYPSALGLPVEVTLASQSGDRG